ncbi:hypothetical protein [Nocardioides convexus]|nr:hypothetical protein [Nocardioides convexus]
MENNKMLETRDAGAWRPSTLPAGGPGFVDSVVVTGVTVAAYT